MIPLKVFKKWIPFFFVAFTLFLHSCDVSTEEVESLSTDRLITSFEFEGLESPAPGRIVDSVGVINVTVPFGTDLTNLVPTISVSDGATIEPASGVPQNFTRFVVYKVTSEGGQQKGYTVFVGEGDSNDARLKSIALPDLYHVDDISDSQASITFKVPFGTDPQNVRLQLEAHEPNATINPPNGSLVDLTNPISVTVTAPDGIVARSYTLSLEIEPQETGIRGVWLTNVDSNVLNSQSGIQEAVDKCAELNINTIFVVTYNKAETTYPSEVMENLTGKRIGNAYTGRDPLRELIDAAHAKDIKVFAWFEYGFAAFNGSPGPILEAKPEWAAIGRDGNQVVKNGFYWLNSLHPEVQDFMTSLVLEVVTNYPDIDGVQGDDRLPAMPTEAGYDDYTKQRYAEQHNGSEPPSDTKDGFWVQWRADILSEYARDLYQKVKAINSNCLVAMSPSPMNFGLSEYLQDYPTWVNDGYCDIVSPQVYRRDSQGFGVYRSLLNDQLRRINASKRNTFYPGILSYLGRYIPSEDYMVAMIRENRARGINGEVHFFYNTLLVRDKVLKAMYPGPAIFPF